jgi:hypothetical protein
VFTSGWLLATTNYLLAVVLAVDMHNGRGSIINYGLGEATAA